MSGEKAVALDVVATCWTSAGSVKPLDEPERSPFSAIDRVSAAAGAGYVGLGFAQGDLEVVRDTIGFDALRAHADAVGIRQIEVELASDWWLDDMETSWRDRWSMLLDAAERLRSPWIKIGTSFGEPASSIAPFVEPMRVLADAAANVGTKVALEPLPFAMISSMPQGAQLVQAVDHDAAGLVVDFWHVFRAGTSLDDLRHTVRPEMVFGVEIDDADAAVAPGATLFEDTRDHRRYPGEGAQDVVGFIETMVDLGYRGPWGVEVLSEAHRAKPLDDALEAAFDTTQRCLRAAAAHIAKRETTRTL